MEIRFLNGGYCRQLLWLIDRRSWRWVRFQAVFLALGHPREGWILVDCGYGDQFAPATRRFPFRFYRWATPVKPAGSTSDLLRRSGIDPQDVRNIIITHFHADHIGGLREFPHAQVHYHSEALRPLANRSPIQQVRAGFLPHLVPDWLPARAREIPPAQFADQTGLPFPAHDLFGDRSVTLLSMPGHAPGHLGIRFARDGQDHLYATDAYWHPAQIAGRVDLMKPLLRLQWDPAAYVETVRRLRDLHHTRSIRILACHAPDTQPLVHSRDPV